MFGCRRSRPQFVLVHRNETLFSHHFLIASLPKRTRRKPTTYVYSNELAKIIYKTDTMKFLHTAPKIISCLFCSTLWQVHHVRAALITATFEGTTGNGNEVSGTFSYDPDSPPCEDPQISSCNGHSTEPNDNLGIYPLVYLDLVVDGNLITFSAPTMTMTVNNNSGGFGVLDRFSISVSDSSQSFSIEATKLNGGLFSDDSIPTCFTRHDFDTAHPQGLIAGASLGDDGTGDLTIFEPSNGKHKFACCNFSVSYYSIYVLMTQHLVYAVLQTSKLYRCPPQLWHG